MNRLTHLLLFAFAVTMSTSLALGQTKPPEVKTPYIPKDAVGHVTIRAAQVINDPALKLVPWEIAAAAGWDNFGFDPTKIERVDVIIGLSKGPPLKFCAVINFKEDVKVDDAKLLELINSQELSLMTIAPRKVLVGTYDYIERVLEKPEAECELSKQVTRIGETGVVTAVFVTEPMRSEIEEAISEAPEDSQALLRTIATNTQMCALRAEWKPKLSVPVLIETASPQAAQEVNKAWLALLKKIFLENNLSTKSLGEADTPVKAAAIAYEKRYMAEVARSLTPIVTGNRLLIRLDAKVFQTLQSGSMLGAITPAILAAENRIP